MMEGILRREKCHRDGRGVLKGKMRGFPHHEDRGDGDVLGKRARENRKNFIALAHMSDASTHRDDAAGTFIAQQMIRRFLDGIYAEHLHHIAEIQARGLHFDLDLARLGRLPFHRAEFHLVESARLDDFQTKR